MFDDKEFLIVLGMMVNILDKVEYLPDDCPEIEKSELFQKMQDEIKSLTVYLKNRTIEIRKKIDEKNLQDSLRAMSGSKNEDN